MSSIIILTILILICNPSFGNGAQANILASKASRLFTKAKESQELRQRAQLLRETLKLVDSIIEDYPDSLPALNFHNNTGFAGLDPRNVRALLYITEQEMSGDGPTAALPEGSAHD